MKWNRYYQLTAQALGAPEPTLIHIPTDVLGALMPKLSLSLVTNFQGNTIFDNSAAHQDLDFKYTIPFVEGARRTIAWLDAHNPSLREDFDAIDDQIITAWTTTTGELSHKLSNLED